MADERRPLRPLTARPTPELWHALIEATSEALRREHSHVGAEHLLYVLAGEPRSIAGNLLEKHQVRDAVRSELDEAMSHPDYLAGSNRVVDEKGSFLGHMFEGPDGRPFFEPGPPD